MADIPAPVRIGQPGICPRCGAAAWWETLAPPLTERSADPSGFIVTVRKLARTDHKCAACGHREENETSWAETEYPRGDGSPATLRERALVLARRHAAPAEILLPASNLPPRVEQAIAEALTHWPEDSELHAARARCGGREAPGHWLRALHLSGNAPDLLADLADCLAGLVWACSPRLQPYLPAQHAAGDWSERRWWWVEVAESSSRLGAIAGEFLAQALASPDLADGPTQVVAASPGEEAFTAAPAGLSEARRSRAQGWALAAAAASLLALDYRAAVSWQARFTALGPAGGWQTLSLASSALTQESAGWDSLARSGFKAADALAGRVAASETTTETAPPSLPAPSLVETQCPRCRSTQLVRQLVGPEKAVRIDPGSDPRASTVWYGTTIYASCTGCGHGWQLLRVRRTVETEF